MSDTLTLSQLAKAYDKLAAKDAEIERLRRELNLLRELHHSAEKEVNELRTVLEYIKNLPPEDEPDIARRAARRALEGKP